MRGAHDVLLAVWQSSTVNYRALLLQLADMADQLTLPAWQRSEMEITTKPDGSPVTATDVAVETRLRAQLAELYPDDGFSGEEVGERPGQSGRTWIVDGIDGTVSFTMRRPEWSTLISLVVDGESVAGIVTSPGLDRRWYCWPGQRAEVAIAGRRRVGLAVSGQRSLDRSRVASWPELGRIKPSLRRPAERLVDRLENQGSVRPSWGSMVPNGAMLVADGRLDGFVLFGGHPWDHAAPAAVVRAAGGRFTALDGSRSLHAGSGVYTNGLVHDELIELLAFDARDATG